MDLCAGVYIHLPSEVVLHVYWLSVEFEMDDNVWESYLRQLLKQIKHQLVRRQVLLCNLYQRANLFELKSVGAAALTTHSNADSLVKNK